MYSKGNGISLGNASMNNIFFTTARPRLYVPLNVIHILVIFCTRNLYKMSLAKRKAKNTQDKLYKVRSVPVSALEVAEGRTRVSERIHTGLKAHLTARILTPTQKQALDVLYTVGTTIQEHHFHVHGPEAHLSQVKAFALMAAHGLDIDSREEPGDRWTAQSSTTTVGPGQTRRYLLQ
ncbi:hypothetical protein EV421DRAFT_535143 [Armillaria borealis]|uniref:Uncharacterized protein n=1 Tax=Armillaria borealis TaxID=47425 RepID=A0AA39JJ75_9AGAR|nr:hypothetical protein EV421DRAFT_535143 [Armillaria borealis]